SRGGTRGYAPPPSRRRHRPTRSHRRRRSSGSREGLDEGVELVFFELGDPGGAEALESGPDVIGAAFAERGGSEIDRGLPLVPTLGGSVVLLGRSRLLRGGLLRGRSGLLDRLIGGELVRLVVGLGSGGGSLLLGRSGLLRGGLLLRRGSGLLGLPLESGDLDDGSVPEERREDLPVVVGQRNLEIESDRGHDSPSYFHESG